MAGKREHFYINDDVKEVLIQVKENTPGINNLSQALRFIVLKHNNETESKEDKKYNAISKEVSMILEITSNLADEQNLLRLKPVSEIPIYTEAKETIENRIKRNTTKAMRYKHNKKTDEGPDIEETKSVNTKMWDD